MTSDVVRREFVKSAFDAYSKLQDAVQSGFTSVRSAALSPLDAVSGLVQGVAPDRGGEAGDVQELRRRVAELEARAKKAKPRARRRKSKR